MKKFLLAGIALSFGAALTATTALADIMVGIAGPLTGQLAAYGEQYTQASTARRSCWKWATTPVTRSRP
jgi:hypothetical protein